MTVALRVIDHWVVSGLGVGTMTTYINTVSSCINIRAHFGWRVGMSIAVWVSTSCIVVELLGYWFHRLLHSGAISILAAPI